MTKKQQTRKIYIDHVGNKRAAVNIVPLAFAGDPETEKLEQERQLQLRVIDFNKLAREGGYFINYILCT